MRYVRKTQGAYELTISDIRDKFGYRDRDGDGFRELPDGRPLTIRLGSATDEIDRQYDALWQRSMKAICIRIEFLKQKCPELAKMARLGQLQSWRLGQISFTPEAFAFYGSLYSKNIPFANGSRFQSGRLRSAL